MPGTVESAARGVVAALGGTADYLLASKWIADRYKQIFARVKARHLRRIGELVVPGTITSGTATFTRDSNVVVGNATAQAAWTAVAGAQGSLGNTIIGRSIRSVVAWYEITGVKYPGPDLILRSAFAENTTSGSAYTIAPRVNGLDPDIRWIGESFVNMTKRFPLQRLSIEELDTLAPARDRTGSPAQVFAEVGDVIKDGKYCKGIEVYPYDSVSEIYHFVAYPTVPDLKFNDPLPPEIDEHVLREGALIDYMRYMMAQALTAMPPRIEEAATWRNEYRAQETRWERIIMDAIRADKGTDDLTFILQRAGWTNFNHDIVTAFDMVMARWPR